MLRCAPPGGAAAPHPDAFCAAGSPLPGRRLLLLLLLGLFLDGDAASPAAAASDLGMGKCGVPKPVANARIVYENSHGNKLRYTCLENFKRKAGTSSLIVCEQDAITRKYRWSPPQLVCIYLAVEDTAESHTTQGSHYFRIGIPFFAVILSAGFTYYCYCARSRAPWRQARVPSVEVIPMDPLGSEGGRSASAGEAADPGPANEEDPMLMGLPPPVE